MKKKHPQFLYNGDLFLLDSKDERAPQYRRRKKRYGFSDDETWDLDYTITCFVLPRLKRFKKISASFPVGSSRGEWKKDLSLMIYAFKQIQKDNLNDNNREKVESGLRLFGEKFLQLWW